MSLATLARKATRVFGCMTRSLTATSEPIWVKHLDAKRAALRAARDLNLGVRVPEYPLALFLEVSNVCNYQCAFCASFSALNPKRLSVLKRVDRGFLDVKKCGKNLDDLVAHALTVYLFGRGEATLHPRFPDLVRYVSERGTQVEFTTNGFHVDEKLSRLLIEQRVRSVHVSFSGTTKSEYENFYLNGDFDRVVANVKRLAKMKQAAGSAYPTILIHSIAFRHHVEKLPEFVDLMAEAGANVIVVNALALFAEFPELFHHAAVFNPERDGPLLAEARRRAEAHGVIFGAASFEGLTADSAPEEEAVLRRRTSGNLPASDAIAKVAVPDLKAYARGIRPERQCGEKRDLKEVAATADEAQTQLAIGPVPDMPQLFCCEPFRMAYVQRDGNVMPCCLWGNRDVSFGDLTKSTGYEIWNGPAFTATRDALLAGEYPQSCHFCVRSRCAPEDAHIWQITAFIDWYRERFGVDLAEEFGPQILHPASKIFASLRDAKAA